MSSFPPTCDGKILDAVAVLSCKKYLAWLSSLYRLHFLQMQVFNLYCKPSDVCLVSCYRNLLTPISVDISQIPPWVASWFDGLFRTLLLPRQRRSHFLCASPSALQGQEVQKRDSFSAPCRDSGEGLLLCLKLTLLEAKWRGDWCVEKWFRGSCQEKT